MNRQQLFAYVKKTYGTEPDYPWMDRNAVLRHADNKKWYGAVLEVSRDKIGLPGDGLIDVLNVKSDPMLVDSLRTQKGFCPAYHMNKEKWISILLDNSASDQQIRHMLSLSYELTAKWDKGTVPLSHSGSHTTKKSRKTGGTFQ